MMEDERGITTFGWLDGNPVHFLTTADGSGTAYAHRERKMVTAHTAIKKNNAIMMEYFARS
jgi:hypothetical protein